LHILRESVCSLNYPERKAHVSYYIFICGLSGSTIFFLIILWMAQIFENVIEDKMYVSSFSTTCVRKISHSKKNWVKLCHKCT